MLPFFPRDVLDDSWDLIESISEDFPTRNFHGRILPRSAELLFIDIFSF